MALQNSEIEQLTIHVVEHVRQHLAEWLEEKSLGKPWPLYEVEMRERIVRVEEELRHQRELMQYGFAQIDKRFEEMITLSNKRFEQMEKRFEQVDKRFEQVDKRFEEMLAYSNKLHGQVEKRFEQVDKRFEEMLAYSDKLYGQIEKRFEQVDKRLEQMDKRLEQQEKRTDELRIDISKRFEQMELNNNIKYEYLNRRLDRFMFWSFGMMVTMSGMIISVLKFWH